MVEKENFRRYFSNSVVPVIVRKRIGKEHNNEWKFEKVRKKYAVDTKGQNVVTEELEQRILAKKSKANFVRITD